MEMIVMRFVPDHFILVIWKCLWWYLFRHIWFLWDVNDWYDICYRTFDSCDMNMLRFVPEHLISIVPEHSILLRWTWLWWDLLRNILILWYGHDCDEICSLILFLLYDNACEEFVPSDSLFQNIWCLWYEHAESFFGTFN